MSNIIKDFEELVKSESEFWEKFKLQFITSSGTRNWIRPVKEIINIMIAELERLSTRHEELLNSAISNKLTLEQKFQINDLINSSRNYLIKLNTGLTILLEQNNDERRDLLFKRGQEILDLGIKFHDKIDQEIKESYWDLQDKFIQKFGETCDPFTVEDPYGDRVEIRSFFSHVVITDKKGKNLLPAKSESYKIILKALKLNSDETKEEELN